ncbi:MAG: alkaline phosphatase [Tannerella sp.]|jgi:alkaline phosphatase|nr:alkaline phosphatase [Tannerella sp.]
MKLSLNKMIFCLIFVFPALLSAQEVRIHSHNDYRQRAPFYQAYAQQVSYIEADIYATDTEGELLVAHNREDLSQAPALDEAYIQPIITLFKRNGGRAWRRSDKILTLCVDLKTPAHPTLDRLTAKLKAFPEVFDPQTNPLAVRIVISGSVPDATEFNDYPPFIMFDGSRTDYTAEQLKRIATISFNFRDYSQWNGKGSIKDDELEKVTAAIAKVHALGKPIRFWGSPDGVTAWNTFRHLTVDIINTDHPEDCAAFFRDFHNKYYRIADADIADSDMARARRLDRTTVGFEGFNSRLLQLSKKIPTYQPAYRNDGTEKKIKNVIFLIGDGMGLVQVCAADAVNSGLSMLKMLHIGLQRTQAADAYTTDSAAAGSALATGKKHKNRHISADASGKAEPSLTDVFYKNGYACGVVTLGNIADATPAAFYGHSVERDNSDEITACLLYGKLNLLNGSGMSVLTDRNDGLRLTDELKKAGYTFSSSVEDIEKTKSKLICIDERMDKAASEETLSLLADATRGAIRKLNADSKKGFFLMVEGAKIDYAGHANSFPGSIVETLSFDLAVAEALKFADSNGETLVIVTGDHETGGLTMVDGDGEQGSVVARYMTDDHTPVMLPVYAYGPYSNRFTGVYENTALFHTIIEALKFKELDAVEK